MIEINIRDTKWVLWDEHTIKNIDMLISDMIDNGINKSDYDKLFDDNLLSTKSVDDIRYVRELILLSNIKIDYDIYHNMADSIAQQLRIEMHNEIIEMITNLAKDTYENE